MTVQHSVEGRGRPAWNSRTGDRLRDDLRRSDLMRALAAVRGQGMKADTAFGHSPGWTRCPLGENLG